MVTVSDDPYLDSDTGILRNKIGARSFAELDNAERLLSGQRAMERLPKGKFDLGHLCALHRHLFQDVYDWAGELRTVEISKGGSHFQFVRFIRTGMADVHGRLVKKRFQKGLATESFANEASVILGDINHCHPFREGNGRTQMLYFKQLAEAAGHPVDLARLDRDLWMEASRRANLGDYALMAQGISRMLP